ncbi:hypothetical protein N5E02_03895 [Stenotrophomonas sp. GD03777]|uniref:hypothetical protein n=1 Tax=Stenotrophomonas sp. GD03777 TaxID=2975380 RepID=UPI00244B593A|nr:hypothetical protein [Stenotrophomonas sp. GD03777]MDH1660555.1 hypothetical protein [Stenotrophomonas sp. GD03777]
MEFAIFCVAIAFATGMLGASPGKAFLMGFSVGFVSALVAIAIERRLNDWADLYPISILALLFGVATATMALSVSKLKR